MMIVKEICTKAGIEKHESVIREVIGRVEQLGFRVSCDYRNDQSKIEWTKSKESRLIRIGIKSEKVKGIKVLWDLLHELGHLIDGEPSEGNDIVRERSAWEIAEQTAREFPVLKMEMQNLSAYKDECLKSYDVVSRK